MKDLIMSAAKKDQNPKLRIKLKSYDIRMLEASVGKVISLLIKSGAEVKGPIPLPKKKKIYTVLRSNFKFKKSREQFERISYTRMIDVTETGAKTVEYLQNLSIPVGILVDVKVF
ncbi:MAG: 30S ribosomal protein S10 [Candidatus Peribacteria bacterium]|nr:30S ribosomal protein S10 [Candidatus Peribacteria bacterium]